MERTRNELYLDREKGFKNFCTYLWNVLFIYHFKFYNKIQPASVFLMISILLSSLHRDTLDFLFTITIQYMLKEVKDAVISCGMCLGINAIKTKNN